ncbi:unnamed protein product [Closterium sp. NIES-53]
MPFLPPFCAPGATESTALGARESVAPGTRASALSGTALAQVLHTFTLDLGASRSFFRVCTTLTPLKRLVAVSLADPSGGPVLAHSSTVLPCPAAPSGFQSGLYLPSFSTNLVSGADLQDGGYTLTTESPPVAASGQVAASSQVFAAASRSGPEFAPCSCRLLSHQTLLWHHRLGHPSLPRLRGMASCVLVSGLPRSLPPLPLGPASTCVPCVEGRQRAAPHSSEFPSTEAPLQTLHMDVKGEGTEVLIDWICVARLQLRERFGSDFPVLRLHSDRGGEFSSHLLRAFCRAEGIRQMFTLPASPQQNGIAERCIGMVMDVARTSMIHAAAPHFLWPFAVQYAAHQLNLQPRVSMPETSPTLWWTGKVGDASAFRVWGSRAFDRDLSADKLSSRAVPCVFLGFPPDAPGWQFYHPTSRRVLSSQDVTFDESVDAVELVEVAVDSGTSGGAEPACAEPGGAGSGGDEPEHAEPGGDEPEHAEPGGADAGGAEHGVAASGGAEPAGAGPGGPSGCGTTGARGSAFAGGAGATSPGGARTGGTGATGRDGATGAGAPGAAGAGSAAGVGNPGGTRARAAESFGGPLGARAAVGARGTGAGGAAGGTGARGADGAGAPVGAGVDATGAAGGTAGVGADAARTVSTSSGGATQLRPYFVPLLEQVLSLPPSSGPAPSLECPPPVQSESQLQLASPLPAPSPYAGPTRGLAERREPESRPASPVRTAHASRRVPRQRPRAVPSTHQMALRPSTASQRVPLPSPPASSLPALADPSSDSLRAASPAVTRFLATADSDPSFESAPASTLVAELVDFAAHCRLDYAASLVPESAFVCPSSVGGDCALSTDVLEDRQEELSVLQLLYLISCPRCFSGRQPWMQRWLPGSPQAPTQREGVDYFQTFSPTPKMTPLRVLLHVAAHRDYELHSLDFSTAFLQGSLHEEIWLRRPPGFTGSFPPGLLLPLLFFRTNTLLPPFYILVYVDDLVFGTAHTAGLAHMKSELQKRHTCTDLGELRSYLGLQITRDRAQRTITLTQSHMVQQVLQRFDFTYSSPQATPLSTRHSLSALPSDESVEPSGPYPELVGCLMYLMTCTRPDLAYPLSILARYVAPGRHRPEHMAAAKRVLRYLCSTSGMGLVLGGRSPVVLTGHADASWVDDLATQRSSQGYTFSLGSGSVSWRSTRSSSVLNSSCEACQNIML